MVVCISMLKSNKLKYVYVRDNVSIHILAVKSIILNDVFYSLSHIPCFTSLPSFCFSLSLTSGTFFELSYHVGLA